MAFEIRNFIRIILIVVAASAHADGWDCNWDFEDEATAPPMSTQYNFWQNPYHEGFSRAQSVFIKTLGGDIRKDEIVFRSPEVAAKRYNEKVDELISKKIVDPKFAIYWATPYVSLNDGRLVFARLGEPAPVGAILFRPELFRIKYVGSDGRTVYEMNDEQNIKTLPAASGILSDADFLWAVSGRHFPGTFADERLNFNEGRSPIGEPSFMHELGHLGGFIEVPEGMMAFRKCLLEIRKNYGGFSKERDRRLFFANEMLLLMKSNARSELTKFLRGFGMNEINREKIIAHVSQFDDKKFKTFRKALIAWHYHLRLPFGGAIRSGTMVRSVGDRLDRTVIESIMLPDHQQYVRGGLPEGIRNFVNEEIADYIFGAEALSGTTVQGWFDLATQNTPLKPGTPYYRYLCEGRQRVDYAQYFCP